MRFDYFGVSLSFAEQDADGQGHEALDSGEWVHLELKLHFVRFKS